MGRGASRPRSPNCPLRTRWYLFVLVGTLLLDERWSRPGWHIVLGIVGLVLALGGAVVISIAGEAGKRGRTREEVVPEHA